MLVTSSFLLLVGMPVAILVLLVPSSDALVS